jgi:hypothetical protein
LKRPSGSLFRWNIIHGIFYAAKMSWEYPPDRMGPAEASQDNNHEIESEH